MISLAQADYGLMATPLKRLQWTLPTRTQRTCIMGHTGCGKTQQAYFLVAYQPTLETMPWVVMDYKGDELINSTPYAKHISLSDTPKEPGVHIVHPLPHQEEAVDNFLWRIWERGHTGLYIDEAYMLRKSNAYPAILTQGRSKHIPTISLTQKPSWVPSQVFSEADHFSAFHMNDRRDHKRVNEFAPFDLEKPIPEYHSWWYRVKDRAKMILSPVPDADSLRDIFAVRLKPKRRLL